MTAALLSFIWIPVAFFCGAIPFSVIIGRLAAGKDIRATADGNPGATNVMRTAGKGWGLLALVLDML